MHEWHASMKKLPDPNAFKSNKDFYPILDLFAKYATKLYGMSNIQANIKNNKGTTLLDVITMSDVAYVVTLIENNVAKWEEAIEIEALHEDEQAKFKPKNRRMLSDATAREKYTKKKSKFTNRKGRKSGYLGHGWSKDGIEFYNSNWKMWRKFSRNKEVWGKMEIAWESYVMVKGFGKQWNENSAVCADACDMEDEALGDAGIPHNHFSLPGDNDFEYDRADSEEDSGSISDGEDTGVFNGKQKSFKSADIDRMIANGNRRKRIMDDSGSSSDSDDAEEENGKVPIHNKDQNKSHLSQKKRRSTSRNDG